MKANMSDSKSGWVFWVILAGLAAGWGSVCYAVTGQQGVQAFKTITDVRIADKPDSVEAIIRGDRLLTYTSVKQASPLGLVLYFSRTALGTSENFFAPPNDIIASVSAAQLAQNGTTTKVEILLKREAYYEVSREGMGLRIAFNKSPGAARSRPVYPEPAPQETSLPIQPAQAFEPPPEPVPANSYPAATMLQSVYAAKFGDSLKVFVGADGMITNYRSFTIESPPRVVFDVFNISSPYKKEKVIPVNTEWVSQIRYFSYPDRVRVILETRKRFLNAMEAHPVENGLMIQMGEGAGFAAEPVPAQVPPSASGVPGSVRIQSVYASQMDSSMLITVRGDGAIQNYKTSVSENPPQIIVDMFGVESAYQGSNSFPVDTQWVKSVRHQEYPDRVQMIIDTRYPYLSAFSARPDASGLIVQVGPAPAGTAAGADRTSAPDVMADVDYTKPARLSRIEFTEEGAGKSMLLIDTSRPVMYDVKEASSRELAVKLYNTHLPEKHRRPLITDRFESAVDRILPGFDGARRGTASIDITLRESAPYFVEQNGNILKIHFEASSLPPQPVTSVPTVAQAPAYVPESPPAAGGYDDVGTVPPSVTLPSVPDAVPISMDETSATLDLPPESAFSVDEAPVYTGEKIALDFYETDVKNVFRILREISGKNFAVDKDVTGKVTLSLAEPVPWDQVLDLILKMNKLGKSIEGNIIRIATRQTLDEEEKLRKEKRDAEIEKRDQQQKLAPLITEYLPVNYSNAETEILPHIEKLVTKDRGSVSVDARTNMVILTDTAEKIGKAKGLIQKLDRVTPQVIIEARIVEASTNFSRMIGTQWEMGVGVQLYDIEGADDLTDDLNSRVGYGPERGYDALGGTYGYNFGTNFPIAEENAGTMGFSFMRIAGTPLLLNAQLQAMESQGEGKIISAPKIVTLDNKTASIKQGVSYPYQTVEDGEVSVEFKDVDLSLDVTPHVTPDNRISMKLNITKNDLGNLYGGEQSFTKKEALTELLINDGDTVVIGGIIKTTENSSSDGIPGLSKIPLLGWLFKTDTVKQEKEELLIFITPRIVQLEQRTAQF